mmetsp:Transcript_23487/g.61885  ORF Transcript_23487/g.61885 Transcript_23487/m.61885 type:complete len:204 (+) Transcript_23487:749-1360(+)
MARGQLHTVLVPEAQERALRIGRGRMPGRGPRGPQHVAAVLPAVARGAGQSQEVDDVPRVGLRDRRGCQYGLLRAVLGRPALGRPWRRGERRGPGRGAARVGAHPLRAGPVAPVSSERAGRVHACQLGARHRRVVGHQRRRGEQRWPLPVTPDPELTPALAKLEPASAPLAPRPGEGRGSVPVWVEVSRPDLRPGAAWPFGLA